MVGVRRKSADYSQTPPMRGRSGEGWRGGKRNSGVAGLCFLLLVFSGDVVVATTASSSTTHRRVVVAQRHSSVPCPECSTATTTSRDGDCCTPALPPSFAAAAFQPSLWGFTVRVRGGGVSNDDLADDADHVTTGRRRKTRSTKGREAAPASLSSRTTKVRKDKRKSTQRTHDHQVRSRDEGDDDGADDGDGATTTEQTTTASSAKGRRRQQHRRHRHESKATPTILQSSSASDVDDTQPLTSPRPKRKHTKRRKRALIVNDTLSKRTTEEMRHSRDQPSSNDVDGDRDENEEDDAGGQRRPEASDVLRPPTETGQQSSGASSRHATTPVGPAKKRKRKKKRSTPESSSTSDLTSLAEAGEPAVDASEEARNLEEISATPDTREQGTLKSEREVETGGSDAISSDTDFTREKSSDEGVVQQPNFVAADDAGGGTLAVEPPQSEGPDALEDGTGGATPDDATRTASDDEELVSLTADVQVGHEVNQGDVSVETVLPTVPESAVAIDFVTHEDLEASEEPSSPLVAHVESIDNETGLVGPPLQETDAAAAPSGEEDVLDASQEGEVADTQPEPANVALLFSPLVSSSAGLTDETVLSGVQVGDQPYPSHDDGHDVSTTPAVLTPDAVFDDTPSMDENKAPSEALHDAIQGDASGTETDGTPEVTHSAETLDSGSLTKNAIVEKQHEEEPDEVDEDDDEDEDEEEQGDGTEGEGLSPADDQSVQVAGELESEASMDSNDAVAEEVVTDAVPEESPPRNDTTEDQTGLSISEATVGESENEKTEDGDEDGDVNATGATLASFDESTQVDIEDTVQLEQDTAAEVRVGTSRLEEEPVDAAAATSSTDPGSDGQIEEDAKEVEPESNDDDIDQTKVQSQHEPKSFQVSDHVGVSIPDGGSTNTETVAGVVTNDDAKESDFADSTSEIGAKHSVVESNSAKFDRDAVLRAADNDSDLLVSVVTWNLAEESPSEEDAAFIRKFRRSKSKSFPGSDFVLIAGQECENIKPRRTEGHRSREFRRLMIKMLGKDFVPIAMHQLGGIQLGLFCKQDLISDLEHVSVADVTCGIGNVFHNKGAIGAFVQLKAQNPSRTGAGSPRRTESLRMLFITAHMAAHVKNTDARDADFGRIATELEAQAPPDFLSHLPKGGGGNKLFDAVDRVFFCGDLNYRIDVPREEAEHSLVTMNELLEAGATNDAEAIRLGLLRHDQLLSSIAERRAFQGFAEGRIKFAPTFKYDKGTGEYDTSHKQRIPAWTDRVLFKPDGVRVLEYASVPEAQHSDHRPVLATFRVSRSGRALSDSEAAKRRRKATTKSSRRRVEEV